MKPTHCSHPRHCALTSSRATKTIDRRCCYSQLQAMLPLHQPWLFPHQLKLPRNTCGHLPWTPRWSFRSSWRKPELGWRRRASSSLYNFAVDIVASSLQQCAGCRASREVGFPGLSRRQWVLCELLRWRRLGLRRNWDFGVPAREPCSEGQWFVQRREQRAERVCRAFVQGLNNIATACPERPYHPRLRGSQKLDWMTEGTEYRAANPLLASYYFHHLKKRQNLQVRFESSKPQHCADLLMRALPYLLFSRVVSFEANTSELAKDGLPSEEQYNDAIFTTLKDMTYQPVSTKQSRKGEGNPDIALEIGGERFVLEGVKFRGRINSHLQRFNNMTNYKNAKHKGLYIIGSDNKKMRDMVNKTQAVDVQVIGLVPNIAHTAYTVHVKSKGIINTFNVECDLVARRLVLKDDGKPELYSVQSLKSVNLSPTAQTRRWVKSCSFVCFFSLSCSCLTVLP